MAAKTRVEYAELGVSAQVRVSWLDPCKVRRVTLVGSSKMAVYNDLAAAQLVALTAPTYVRFHQETDGPMLSGGLPQ